MGKSKSPPRDKIFANSERPEVAEDNLAVLIFRLLFEKKE